MADLKISQLTGATTPLAGTEVLPIVQSGVTKQVSVANLTAGRAVAMAGGAFSDNFTQGTAAKGVNFTANTPAAGMTSQLLNDYQEGTWTPTDTSGAGLTFTQNTTSVYVKVGKLVHCNFDITFPTTSGTQFVTIQLPFTAATNTTITGSVGFQSYGAWIGLYGFAGNSFNLYVASGAALQNVNMSGKRIQCSVSYVSAT